MTASLFDIFPPRKGRMHEVCGPGATGFAAVLAAQGRGPVLWVAESWRRETLNPLGLADFTDPARLLMARAGDATEVLAVTEEALRDGAVPLVVAEIGAPLSLTAGRRLQLAAKAGRATGLCLIPDGMGSNAAETRWHAAPVCPPVSTAPDSTPMRWQLIKNKSGTLGSWDVRWNRKAHRLHVVSPAGKRPGSPGAPG